MWRRFIQAFSVLGFVAGIVGWITIPDDAALWAERLRPIAVAIGREDIIAALFALSALGFAWTIFAPIAAEWVARRRTPPLSVHFPEIANAPQYNTSFRQTQQIWGNLGDDVAPLIFPSIHRFYIGVTNNTPNTIRNVAAVVRYAGVPGWITLLEIRLLDSARVSSHIDIAPRQSVRFFLGEIVRTETTEFGGSMPTIAESNEALWQKLIQAEQQHMIGLLIPHDSGCQSLLRNDGTLLTVAIYGDEVNPSYAVLRLDLKADIRIALWQTRRELTRWPAKRDTIRTPYELD